MAKNIKARILVVEDEQAIATMIAYNLEKEGFVVETVGDGEEALLTIEERKPDMVILDWMLPSISGVEVCDRLRKKEETANIPIMMLTARGEEADRIQGLDTGADDYMVKPFSPKVLVARINAVLRRIRPAFSKKSLDQNGLKIDLSAHKVLFGDKIIKLGPTEFRLLAHFMEHPGHIFSREKLLDNVWGHDIYVESRTVDVHIRRLRKALGETDPSLEDLIKTVRSAGYTMEKQ